MSQQDSSETVELTVDGNSNSEAPIASTSRGRAASTGDVDPSASMLSLIQDLAHQVAEIKQSLNTIKDSRNPNNYV